MADLGVFSRYKGFNDYQAENEKAGLANALAQAQIGYYGARSVNNLSGGNSPAAIKINDEIEKRLRMGDVDGAQRIADAAKLYDKGLQVYNSSVPTSNINPMMKGLATAESNNDPNAVSAKGAAGKYQIMPETAKNPGFGITPLRNWDGVDPRTAPPEEQLRFANDYLNTMQSRFGGDERLAAGAYNAGPGRVDAAIANLPPETQKYIPKVAKTTSRPGYDEALADRAALKKGAETQAQKNVELVMNPKITKDTKKAEEIGKNEGENTAEYENFIKSVPALESTVNKLYLTADRATYTKTGQLVNSFQRQFGFDPGDDAAARSYYENLVRDEIIPILKASFGAQFTKVEGEWLLSTLGDTDKSPGEKKAALRARVDSWKNLVNTRAARAGVENPPETFANFPPSGDIGSGTPIIKTQEQFNALSSGVRYIEIINGKPTPARKP